MKSKILIVIIFLIQNNVSAQWQLSGIQNSTISCFASQGSSIFAGTFTDGLYISTNQGVSWTQSINGLTTPYIRSIAVEGNSIFVATGESGVYLSVDNGQTWTSINNGLGDLRLLSIAASGSIVYAGCYFGGIYKSTNNGSSWSQMNNGISPNDNVDAIEIRGSDVFAGSNNGTYKSTLSSSQWNTITTGLVCTKSQAFGFTSNYIFSGNDGCGIYKSNDNGLNWVATNNGFSSGYVYSIVGSANSVVIGCRSGVAVSSNLGQSWLTINDGLPSGMVRPVMIDNSYIYAGTDSGVYKRSASVISTDDFDLDSYFTISPNPVLDNLITVLFTKELGNCNLHIYDLLGNLILKSSIVSNESNTIDLKNISNGIYFMHIDHGGKYFTKKIIVSQS
ncbi:MAG: T9SS type A sorting domain-containing protein [Bacteroidetes bacterium]|nr:T9SS type A sorting domain-containing protein [Bacteroidota bacterium]